MQLELSESLPSKSANTNSLVLQVCYAIDIIPVTARNNRPAQWVINPVTNDLVSSLRWILRLSLSSQASNPTLGETNTDINFITAQRCDHVARAGWEWCQGDLERQSSDSRGAEGQMEGGKVVLYSTFVSLLAISYLDIIER